MADVRTDLGTLLEGHGEGLLPLRKNRPPVSPSNRKTRQKKEQTREKFYLEVVKSFKEVTGC